MIQRFYKSLLRDEGYISMTLPVSVDAHIWAKLLTSFAWFALEAILSVLAVGVVLSINVSLREELWIWDMFEDFQYYFKDIHGFNAVLYGLEYLALGFLGACAFCLRCYASMAIGHSAANHKLLLSFLTWFAIGVALRMISSALFVGLVFSDAYSVPAPVDIGLCPAGCGLLLPDPLLPEKQAQPAISTRKAPPTGGGFLL